MKSIRKITTYFSPFLVKYKWQIFAILLLWGVGSAAKNSVAPIFYKKIINESTLQYTTNVFDLKILIGILFSIAGIGLFSFVTRRLGSYLLSSFESNVMDDIHVNSFKRVASHTYNFFSNHFTGTLVSKAGILGRNFRDLFDIFLYGFFLLFINIILSIVILWKESFLIALMFIIVTLLFIILSMALSKKQAEYQIIRAGKESMRVGVLSDIFTNIINVKIFANDSVEEGNYTYAVNELGEIRRKAWFYADGTRVLKNLLLIFFEISVMGISLYLFTQQSISIGTLVLVQTYILQISSQVWDLDKSLNGFVRGISESIDAIDVITYPIIISDSKNPEDLRISHGNVTLDNINFTYPDGDHVFENFSLHIPAGQSVGVVGKSGSGKTTITKLLLRFYDIDGGAIKIDDQDIRNIRQDDLRNSIAYIPQESILFHRSIQDNVGYSNPGATDEEVMQAAKFAHADEFIEGFEYGYDTKVGERGVKLSGGQRQRVSIARAMLKDDAALLIMDEATSSLDTLSEQYIQESFEELMKGRTTIVIAHRLSTIQKMDRIIVLDKGELVEDGSHEELLAQGGYYAELWNSQTDGFIQD